MPPRIKLILSCLVLAVVGGYGLFALRAAEGPVGTVILALAAFMVLAIWLFPETGQVKRKSGS